MASYDYTFTSGDTVTPTKLNNARNVKDIVNADIKSDAAIVATKLASDSITNTQIKSDAAILGTKIAPNFGSQSITTTGNATLGNIVNVGTAGTASSQIEVGVGATGNRPALIDFIGDTTYTDYGLRVGRPLSDGANGLSVIEHRGTGGLVLSAADAGHVRMQTSGTERMRIDASGNVGIGTGAPLARLSIDRDQASTVTNVLTLNNAGGGSGNGAALNFYASPTAQPFTARINTVDNANYGFDLVFSNKPSGSAGAGALTERMRIDASGNVGIGKTNPATILDVNGTVTATAFAGPLTGNVTGTASAISDGSVSTAAKIADGVVTPAKLSGAQTGSAPIFGVRAWGKCEGRSDNAACVVNASGNVTSVTRTASGTYEVVMTTALPDANYAILCTSTGSISRIDSFTETATTFRLEFITTANAASNPAEISFMVIR